MNPLLPRRGKEAKFSCGYFETGSTAILEMPFEQRERAAGLWPLSDYQVDSKQEIFVSFSVDSGFPPKWCSGIIHNGTYTLWVSA